MQGGYSWIGIEFGNRVCIQSPRMGECAGSADASYSADFGCAARVATVCADARLGLNPILRGNPRINPRRRAESGYHPDAPDCRSLVFLDCEIGHRHGMTWE